MTVRILVILNWEETRIWGIGAICVGYNEFK